MIWLNIWLTILSFSQLIHEKLFCLAEITTQQKCGQTQNSDLGTLGSHLWSIIMLSVILDISHYQKSRKWFSGFFCQRERFAMKTNLQLNWGQSSAILDGNFFTEITKWIPNPLNNGLCTNFLQLCGLKSSRSSSCLVELQVSLTLSNISFFLTSH